MNTYVYFLLRAVQGKSHRYYENMHTNMYKNVQLRRTNKKKKKSKI